VTAPDLQAPPPLPVRPRAWTATVVALAGLLPAGGCGGEERGGSVPARIAVERASTLRWSVEQRGVRVEAWIDGSRAGRMSLDTGRRRSVVTPATVAAHSLPVARRGEGGAPTEIVARLGFANVDVLDWRPTVGEVDDHELLGILGQDVLARLELVLDRQVEELRILPADGVARELAAFAAEGWRVQALPLVEQDGRLVLEARPVATGARAEKLPTPDPTAVQPLVFEEPPPGVGVAVSTHTRETRLPEVLRSDAGEGTALRVDGYVLQVESAVGLPSGSPEAVLGADFLDRFLVGWDGPARTLYLAERPAVARRF